MPGAVLQARAVQKDVFDAEGEEVAAGGLELGDEMVERVVPAQKPLIDHAGDGGADNRLGDGEDHQRRLPQSRRVLLRQCAHDLAALLPELAGAEHHHVEFLFVEAEPGAVEGSCEGRVVDCRVDHGFSRA